MNDPQHTAYLTDIHALLLRHFSEEELKTLCFTLGPDYADLEGEARSGKARELVRLLDRSDRLAALRQAVLAVHPQAAWPDALGAALAPSAPGSAAFAPGPAAFAPGPAARWQLARADFDRLVGLLAALPEFRTETRRLDLLDDVFAGSPRRADLLGLLDLSGAPRGAAVRVVTRLAQFGQDEPGQETLGLLINKLLEYQGGGAEAEFLRDLFRRYPLSGQPVSTRGLVDWRGRETPTAVQEKIIGENTLRDVRLLELALEASRAVVRIVTADSLGSGFLVAPDLIMTNHHVIPGPAAAPPCAFQFNYQLDRQLKPTPVRAARAKPDGLFYTNPALDVTLVEALDVPAGVAPLTLARLRVQKEERVNIIQHPGGHYKKISMQNNFVAYADAQVIQYLTSTEPGSSGSPVFNNDFVVVGIHHSGGELPEPGGDQVYLRNAGSSMIAVLDDLQANAPALYARLTLA